MAAGAKRPACFKNSRRGLKLLLIVPPLSVIRCVAESRALAGVLSEWVCAGKPSRPPENLFCSRREFNLREDGMSRLEAPEWQLGYVREERLQKGN
jgi:hypothetical protein